MPPSSPMNRRDCLTCAATAVGMTLLNGTLRAEEKTAATPEQKRDYLRPLLYTRADLDAWLAGKAFPFSKYDSELGYLHVERDFKEGMDSAVCSYRYDRLDARRIIAHADKPCRINTYGNSFTSCEQVSDGETWQEVLAAHLGEPVRNYGIGGYSVYQAYLRMKREEKRSPAKYVIFNIFDDDHYRNLLSWQRLRFGINRKSTNQPVPHVHVNPERDEFVERPNPCPTADSLYQLCDLDSAYRLMADDYVLNRYVLRKLRRDHGAKDVPASDFDDPEFTRIALYASQRIIDKVEDLAARDKRTVLYVLSYNPQTVRRRLKAGSRFDQSLVDYLDRRRLPYVDLLKAHAADYAKFAPDVEAYIKRYFIGHYNPLGNFFCAFAIKDKLVALLQPPPAAYAPKATAF